MTDLTDGRRLYVIGDIHGRRDLLADMLARINADLAARPHRAAELVFLGDYVDRGPEARGVIDTLIALGQGPVPATFLLGNHDAYVQAYIEDPDWFDLANHWLHTTLGGAATLASYGVAGADPLRPAATHAAFAAAFPAGHRRFLDGCRLTRRVGGYLFVHAGIRPGVALEAQDREDLIWIREPFLSSTADHGFKVVHGHTIVPRVEHHSNRIAVDTGAVRTGVLSCLVLEGADAALLESGGLRPWPQGSGLGLAATVRGGLRGLWPTR
jgi:serine/threonine protein phosphatase 1